MASESIADEVRAFLRHEFGIQIETLADDDPLFTGGHLDSLNALSVLIFLESRFGLKVDPLDITLQDIDSVRMIADFARARLDR
jgi:acyl carrier protein